MDAAVIVLRLVQFSAAAVLLGAPLFLLYSLRGPDQPPRAWPRPLAVIASLALAAGAAAALVAQTAVMAGHPAAAMDGEMLASVAAETPFGLAMVTRGVAAVAALLLALFVKPGRGLWFVLTGLGFLAVASFAWSGHGAATEGAGAVPHLVADILHLLAAGVWVGALAGFSILLRESPTEPAAVQALYAALAGFSGVGSAVVAILVLSGLVNSWFLVGLDGVGRLATTGWGVLLLVKLAVFAAMLALAAANRFRLTPALAAGMTGGDPMMAIAALRRSVALETGAAFLVLALVAALGALAPPAAA